MDITVGKCYIAKVNGRLTVVRLDRLVNNQPIHQSWKTKGQSTSYWVTNLVTKRETAFHSSRKFRREATVAEAVAKRVGASDRCGTCSNCLLLVDVKAILTADMRAATTLEAKQLVKDAWGIVKDETPCTGGTK